MHTTASETASQGYDPDTAIARTAGELRVAFARSRFAAIADALDYSTYFPRSLALLRRQRVLFSAGSLLLCVVVGALAGDLVYALQTNRLAYLVFGMIIGLWVVAAARRLMWSQLHAKTSEHSKFIELPAFDERSPVVYLRRFDYENPGLPTPARRRDGRPIYSSAPPTEPLENLVEPLLHTCGPVIGLGRPGDRSIEHRIFRLYINHDRWQEAVTHFLAQASAVFLQYDRSASLEWELAQVLACEAGLVLVVITDVPEHAATDQASAWAGLPDAVRNCGRSFDFHPHTKSTYIGGNPALLIALDKEGGRIYGTQLHFKALWDIIFKEIVRNSHLSDRRHPASVVPQAYRKLVESESSRDPHPLRSLLFALCLTISSGTAVWFALRSIQP